MMDSIASAASALSAVQVQQQYSVAMAKKAMDTQSDLAQGVLEMLPQNPQGYQFDVYA